MDGLVLCNKGIEDVVARDLNEIIGRNGKIGERFVTFSFEKKEELCEVVYRCPSISKGVLVLDSFSFKSEKDFIDNISKIDLKEWLEGRSFKVLVEGIEQDVAGKIGEIIIKKEYKKRVDLSNPDVVLFVFVAGKKAFFGIDFSGKDLSKREYRIFSHPRNIKATIAYAMVRYSGFSKDEVILDPFCLSGGIVIEAALFSVSISPHSYNKDDFQFLRFMEFHFSDKKSDARGEIYAFDSQFKNVDASKKNAKIAGVHKSINFSRLGVEWLDTKLKRGGVDRIVTVLPSKSKRMDEKIVAKLQKEFFYQCGFVLNKKGVIIVGIKNIDGVAEIAAQNGFKFEEKREVWQGKEPFWLMKFNR